MNIIKISKISTAVQKACVRQQPDWNVGLPRLLLAQTVCPQLAVLYKALQNKYTLLARLSRRFIGELIVYPWSGVRHRPSSVRPSATMLKHLLLRNRLADQSQILCGASLVRGNEIFFPASGSHDQDGRHAHIWYKPFKNLLLQNKHADFHETWYVSLGTPAHHKLFK